MFQIIDDLNGFICEKSWVNGLASYKRLLNGLLANQGSVLRGPYWVCLSSQPKNVFLHSIAQIIEDLSAFISFQIVLKWNGRLETFLFGNINNQCRAINSPFGFCPCSKTKNRFLIYSRHIIEDLEPFICTKSWLKRNGQLETVFKWQYNQPS